MSTYTELEMQQIMQAQVHSHLRMMAKIANENFASPASAAPSAESVVSPYGPSVAVSNIDVTANPFATVDPPVPHNFVEAQHGGNASLLPGVIVVLVLFAGILLLLRRWSK